jgi:hypothetical protein
MQQGIAIYSAVKPEAASTVAVGRLEIPARLRPATIS